ncbi:DUF5655 domain-containing protein [Sphingobacterium haloxyli]|uniref:DUF5655 domain-containing protein n=1 Tax=Sphingobacterium haloxyli TaxID=2100533 RepID=A0A2S9J015_9SPHI|nr:DUF5655 domain-containing protein [Sphingobacterium haloxyli]PRD46088.1 hypothetical protein C5745_16825 [Sphingobacterium haloxyli]
MQLFNQEENKLNTLKEKPCTLEKDMQKLFEANLEAITGLNLVKSEFTIKAQRFDTLAYDADSQSFVIIEYKRERNFSVVDQGVSYLNLMLENKAEFIVEYNESQQENLKRSDVDWSQSKVIFVSPSFTDFQKQASNFKDLPIELWEIKQYEGGIIVVNPIKKSKAAPTIKTIQASADSELEKVTSEVKVYTEDDHLQGKSDSVKELYEAYKTGILNLADDIAVMAKKLYISFEKEKRIILDVVIQSQELKLYINTQYYDFLDLRNLGVMMADKTKWGSGYYQIAVRNTEDLEYIMSLVKQAI